MKNISVPHHKKPMKNLLQNLVSEHEKKRENIARLEKKSSQSIRVEAPNANPRLKADLLEVPAGIVTTS